MIWILAIDPGVTTGYCYGTIENGLKLEVGQSQWTLYELEIIIEKFVSRDNAHVIYESFEYRNQPRTGLNLYPVKMIGVIELFREKFEPLVGFYDQKAAQGKGFYTDAKLKNLGVYATGKEHGRDATRHLLYWLNFGAGGQYVDINRITMELV